MGFAVYPTYSQAETLHPFEQQLNYARADLAAERFGDAKARLMWLFDRDPNPRNSQAYLANVSQITNAHPLQFSTRGSLLGTTNVYKFTKEEFFIGTGGHYTITRPEVEGSGYGVALGGTAALSYAPAVGREWRAALDVDLNYYDIKDLQSLNTRLSLSHSWRQNRQHVWLGASTARLMYQDVPSRKSPDFATHTIFTGVDFPILAADRVTLRANAARLSYRERDHFSGMRYTASAQWRHTISARATATFDFGFTRASLNAAHNAYSGATFGANFAQRTAYGIDYGFGYKGTIRDYDGTYPELTYARKDRVHSLSFSLSHHAIEIGGSRPTLTCTQSWQASNVVFNDFDSFDCGVRFQRSF